MKKGRLLLVGAGHTHIQLLQDAARWRREGAEVTLLAPERAIYSGRLPQFIMGQFTLPEISFDVARKTLELGLPHILEKAEKVYLQDGVVLTSQGKLLPFDFLSLDVGIQSASIPVDEASRTRVVYLKPINDLPERLKSIGSPKKIAVIGGGAAAYEVAQGLRGRFPLVEIRLLVPEENFLSGISPLTRERLRAELLRRNISHESFWVEEISEGAARGKTNFYEADAFFVATTAEALPFMKDLHLIVDEKGFVEVDQSLRARSDPRVFAAGDCISFPGRNLPKAGVFAVREGAILRNSLASALGEKLPEKFYEPQKDYLKVLVTGEKSAMAIYKNFSWNGRLGLKLKEYLDGDFLRRFS